MHLAAAIFLMLAAEPPAFEVASIKPVADPNAPIRMVGCSGGPGQEDPGRITCSNMTLANLMAYGYDINQHYQIAGLDTTMSAPRYEIVAKVPAGATKEQVKVMWQQLLAERFHLAFHRESKDISGYELTVAKGGPKLTPAAEAVTPVVEAAPPKHPGEWVGEDGYPKIPPGSGITMMSMGGKARWRVFGEPVAALTKLLAGHFERPVADATGLTGKYDFNLYWVADSGRVSDVEAGPTLERAVANQFGLKLEAKKVPTEILVVDAADKVPTEN